MPGQTLYNCLIDAFLVSLHPAAGVQQKVNLDLTIADEPANVFSREGAITSDGSVPPTEKLVHEQGDTIFFPLPLLDENGDAQDRNAAFNKAFSLRLSHWFQGGMNDKTLEAENPPECISAKTIP